MARIRSIKPEFWTDSLMVQMPLIARLLYIALWTAADDHGYIPDEPDRLAMELMPREDTLEVDAALQLLIASGRIDVLRAPDGTTFMQVTKWSNHQRPSHPAQSKISREGSRKLVISQETRRAVAAKYGCPPGGIVDAACYYCGAPGQILWNRLYPSGRPAAWVTFPGLELDHFLAESEGGATQEDNLVLACRSCNRQKANKPPIAFLSQSLTPLQPDQSSRVLARIPEDSARNREQGTWNGEHGAGSSKQQSREAIAPPLDRDALLTAATNRGITQRYGEQPHPIRFSHPSVADTLAAFDAAGVPDEFASRVLFEKASACPLDRPPRSLGYFRQAVIEAWQAEQAHRQAATFAVPAVEGGVVIGEDVMHRRMAVKFAKQGDPEWQAECQRLGIAWEAA